jgi:hypothetical protein
MSKFNRVTVELWSKGNLDAFTVPGTASSQVCLLTVNESVTIKMLLDNLELEVQAGKNVHIANMININELRNKLKTFITHDPA